MLTLCEPFVWQCPKVAKGFLFSICKHYGLLCGVIAATQCTKALRPRFKMGDKGFFFIVSRTLDSRDLWGDSSNHQWLRERIGKKGRPAMDIHKIPMPIIRKNHNRLCVLLDHFPQSKKLLFKTVPHSAFPIHVNKGNCNDQITWHQMKNDGKDGEFWSTSEQVTIIHKTFKSKVFAKMWKQLIWNSHGNCWKLGWIGITFFSHVNKIHTKKPHWNILILCFGVYAKQAIFAA